MSITFDPADQDYTVTEIDPVYGEMRDPVHPSVNLSNANAMGILAIIAPGSDYCGEMAAQDFLAAVDRGLAADPGEFGDLYVNTLGEGPRSGDAYALPVLYRLRAVALDALSRRVAVVWA